MEEDVHPLLAIRHLAIPLPPREDPDAPFARASKIGQSGAFISGDPLAGLAFQTASAKAAAPFDQLDMTAPLAEYMTVDVSKGAVIENAYAGTGVENKVPILEKPALQRFIFELSETRLAWEDALAAANMGEPEAGLALLDVEERLLEATERFGAAAQLEHFGVLTNDGYADAHVLAEYMALLPHVERAQVQAEANLAHVGRTFPPDSEQARLAAQQREHLRRSREEIISLLANSRLIRSPW